MAKEKRNRLRDLNSKKSGSQWLAGLSATKKDLLSILLLYALVLVLFHKIVFNNMIFSDAGDTAAATSLVVAGKHLEDTEHIEVQWMPYFFSGMPTFGSLAYASRGVNYVQTAIHFVGTFLFLRGEMSWMVLHYFLGGLFMFFLLRFLDFKQVPSLLGAITFALSPAAVGLAGAGHGSKLWALSYLPLVFLLTCALLRKRDLLSLGLLSASLATLLLTNHIQMVFYGLLVVGLYTLYEIVLELRTQPRISTAKATLVVIALVVGFASSAFSYFSAQEYAQYSIRGGGQTGAPGGLAYDYATNWSFHPFEIMNFFIPSFFGLRSPYYWGWMPFTESSLYFGLIPLLLGIIALVYRRNRMTVFLALLSFITLLISFGKHFPVLFDLMFDYLPFFNKFRTPSMILHLLPFTFGILAAYGMSFILEIPGREKEFDTTKLKKVLLIVLVILGVGLVVGFLAGGVLYDSLSGFMFEKPGEIEQLRAQYGQQAARVLEQLKKIRFDLLWNGKELPGIGFVWEGYVRIALFEGAAVALILFYLKRKVKAGMFSAGVVALLALDLLIIDASFVHPKPNTALKQQFQPDETIRFLKTDTSLYRILPLGQLFQDNTYMYHLVQSIGGYSPAKLKIYQEVLDSCLYRGWDPNFPLNMSIVNMLNTKYILSVGRLPEDKFSIVHVDQSKSLVTSLNPGFLPRAWFVDETLVAPNRTEVFRLLNSASFDPRHQAILEKAASPAPAKADSSDAAISDFKAHEITVEAFCNKPALLVLSEVYYPKGWKAYVDGIETEIYKTNYILRSVVVPEGRHTVVFRYHSDTYDLGLLVSSIGWGTCALLIIAGLVINPTIRARLRLKKPETNKQQNPTS